MSPTIRNESSRSPIRASRIGCLAARTLAVPRTGTIEAVFDRSVYCLLGREYVCLGVESLGMGPLTATFDIPEAHWSSLGFRISLPVTVSPGRMEFGNGVGFDLDRARIWSPRLFPVPGREDVRKGLRLLEEAAAGRIPPEGLGRFLFVDPQATFPPDRVSAHAEKPVVDLKKRLSDSLENGGSRGFAEGSDWRFLLGLGPGLTPSGDDFLGGMMLALHCLGEPGPLQSLSASVEGALAERTGPISAAHLRAAMKGVGSEALHGVLAAVLSGDAGGGIQSLLKAVGETGHTSGWDALAGIAVACRVWMESTTGTQFETR